MGLYKEMMERHMKEYEDFPKYYAFGHEQFQDLLSKLNLTEDQFKDQYTQVFGGALISKAEYPKYKEMLNNQHEELTNALVDSTNDYAFFRDAISDELNNHEFGYTGSDYDALMALGINETFFKKNPKLFDVLQEEEQKIIDFQNSLEQSDMEM